MARSTANFWDKKTPYESWIESTGAPIHRGYYIEDCRTVELGYWPERECDAAFIQLVGQEGVTGAYVTEIPPGKTLPSFRVAIDEVVYVLARPWRREHLGRHAGEKDFRVAKPRDVPNSG